jgi:hypothetical protein
MKFTQQYREYLVGGAFMPAPPMYRPGERLDGPLADTSALRQSIVRLRYGRFWSLIFFSPATRPGASTFPPCRCPQLHRSRHSSAVLRALVEQAGDRRGAAFFALGYWAGCRVSELSWLKMADTHVGPKAGWLHIGTNDLRYDFAYRVRAAGWASEKVESYLGLASRGYPLF